MSPNEVNNFFLIYGYGITFLAAGAFVFVVFELLIRPWWRGDKGGWAG